MRFTASPNSWPAVLVGLMLLAYWLRVLQLVARTRAATGRAANIVPPEPLGRIVRLVWAPVVVLWILVPLMTPFLINAPAFLRPIPAWYTNRIIGWSAVVIAAAAFAATWVCWIKMGSSWRVGIDPNERTVLVFNGPYAYVRHPIYALSSLLMITAIAVVPSPMMILVGVLHLLFLQWEARREERYLTQLHGPAYAGYIARVGRFFPKSLGTRASLS